MKISLCKHTKDVEKSAKFLERNLRNVKIEIKGCIGQCDDCDKKLVAKIDGKDVQAKDAYGLLKEIRKYLKKKDKLEFLNEEAMKQTKKEMKEAKEAKVAKDAKDAKEAKEDRKAEKEEKKKSGKDSKEQQNKADGEEHETQTTGRNSKQSDEPVQAKIEGNEIVLTVPNETFSMDHMKISVHFGSFGQQSSTYEVVKTKKTEEDKLNEKEEAKVREKASVMTFSVPNLLPSEEEPD